MNKHSKWETMNNQYIEDIARDPVCYSIPVSGKVQGKICLPMNKCIHRIMTGNVLGCSLEILSIILVVDDISAQQIQKMEIMTSHSHIN